MKFSRIGLAALVLLLGTNTAWVDSPVADAAQQGDLGEVRELLRAGSDVNAAQGDGMTALHWAASRGDDEMVGVLLYAGAVAGARTRLGNYTPLHLAARNGRSTTVATLVESGAAVTVRSSTGVTPLHLAAMSGADEAVAALIAAGSDMDAKENGLGQTPLHWATAANRTGAMRRLIDAGADVQLTTKVIDYQRLASLDGADRRSRQELTVAAREAAEAAEERRRALSDETPAGTTGAAAEEEVAEEQEEENKEEEAEEEEEEEDQQVQVTNRIPGGATQGTGGTTGGSQAGASPQERPLSYNDLVGKEGGLSALHFASREGFSEGARILLKAGAEVDQTSGDGTTPLLMAIINGNYDLGVELLEAGADPNRVGEDGVAPLFAALNNRWAPKAFYPQPTAFKQQRTTYLELMAELLRAGAEVDQRTGRHVWYTSYNFDILGV